MTTLSVWARASATAEEIRAEAARLDPAKVLLTLAMIPFVVIGFVAAGVTRGAWVVVAFAWVALVVGYRKGGGPVRRESG